MPLLPGEGGRPQLPCPGLEETSKEAAVGRMSWADAPVGAPLPAPLRCTPGPAGGGRPQWDSDSLCSPANQGNQPVHMPRPWRTLDPKRPASLGSGTGLGRAVLPKTQPRTQSRGAPALPRPVHTAREHIHGGWHTSALSQALRGREPTGRGLPSSPQGGAPEVRVAWVPGGLTALPGRGHLGPGAGVTITTELSDLRGWPSLRGSLGLFPRHGEMVPA